MYRVPRNRRQNCAQSGEILCSGITCIQCSLIVVVVLSCASLPPTSHNRPAGVHRALRGQSSVSSVSQPQWTFISSSSSLRTNASPSSRLPSSSWQSCSLNYPAGAPPCPGNYGTPRMAQLDPSASIVSDFRMMPISSLVIFLLWLRSRHCLPTAGDHSQAGSCMVARKPTVIQPDKPNQNICCELVPCECRSMTGCVISVACETRF